MRLLAIIFILFAPLTNAVDVVPIIGGGTLSCGKWVAAVNSRNEPQQKIFVQWVAGFTGS